MTNNNGALVDIGAKAPAFLPTSEASIQRIKSVEEIGLSSGFEDEFFISRSDDDNGRMVLSLKKLQLDLAWERCKQLQAEDAIVKSLVSKSCHKYIINFEELLNKCAGLFFKKKSSCVNETYYLLTMLKWMIILYVIC